MSDDAQPVIVTRVAHFGHGDTRFHGYGVRADLVGKCGYWNTISLALGGSYLSPDQEVILDGLATASVNADPRVWPLKIARILSSYGSVTAGIAGSLIALEGGYVGPPAIEGAAQLLVEFRALADGSPDGGDALASEVCRRIEAGQRLMGFGVPNRERDERVLGLLDLADKHQFSTKPFWRLMLAVEAIAVTKKTNRQINVGTAMSAVCLDMGFDPRQIGVLATLILLSNIVANANEGAEQVSAVLRNMPVQCMKYQGPEPRLTPRAAKRMADK